MPLRGAFPFWLWFRVPSNTTSLSQKAPGPARHTTLI